MSSTWFVSRLDLLRSNITALASIALLIIAWTITLASGGTKTALLHVFYLPVLLSAVRWGVTAGLATAVVATILCGPLMPLDVDADVAQPLANWLTRGAFFVLVGTFVGALTHWLRAAGRREAMVAERERDLAVQRAAIVQTVSHEIRTPLTIIIGVAELLQHRDGLVTERGRPLIDSLVRSARNFQGMADMMLAAAEADDAAHVQPVSCTPNEILVDALSHLSRRVDSARVKASGDVLFDRVLTVPEYLKLTLRSLIDNALRFSPPDAPVEVVASHREGQLNIQIRDEGPGLDPSFRERAFEAFTQQDQSNTREVDGIGLGLYTAKRLLDRLDGTIELQPRRPTGTVAVITVPAPLATDAET